MTAAVEHLRSLSERTVDNETEDSPDALAAGGPLFWMAYSRQSISAALSGRSSVMTDEDLPVLCELLASPIVADVENLVSSSDPRTLAGLAFIALFNSCTVITRAFAAQVTSRKCTF